MKFTRNILAISLVFTMLFTILGTGVHEISNNNVGLCKKCEDKVFYINPEKIIDTLSMEELESKSCINRVP